GSGSSRRRWTWTVRTASPGNRVRVTLTTQDLLSGTDQQAERSPSAIRPLQKEQCSGVPEAPFERARPRSRRSCPRGVPRVRADCPPRLRVGEALEARRDQDPEAPYA